MNIKNPLLIFTFSVSLFLVSCAKNSSSPQDTAGKSSHVILDQNNFSQNTTKNKFIPTSSIVLVAKELFKNGHLTQASKAYERLMSSKKLLPLSLKNEMLMTFLYAGNVQASQKITKMILAQDPTSLLGNLTLLSLLNINHGQVSKTSLADSCRIADKLQSTPQKTKKGMFHSPNQLQDYMYKNTINYIHGWCLYKQKGKDEALKYFSSLTKYGALLSNAYIYEGLIHTLEGESELAEKSFKEPNDSELLKTLQAYLWQIRFAYVKGDQNTIDSIFKQPLTYTSNYYNNWRYSEFLKDKSYLTKGMAFSKNKKEISFSDLVLMVYIHQAILLKEIKFNFGANILLSQAQWLSHDNYCLPKLMFADNLSDTEDFYSVKTSILRTISKESYCYNTSRTNAMISSIANHKYQDGKLIIDAIIKDQGSSPQRHTKEIEATIYKNLTDNNKTKEIFKFLLEDKDLKKSQPTTKNANSYYAFTLGTLYGVDKNYDESIKYLKLAISLNPKYSEAYNFLGYTLIDTNKDIKAGINYVKKALQLTPHSVYYMDSLAWGYYKTGRYHKAIELLEIARNTDPNQPEILNHLGDSYYKIGNHDKARMYWKRSKLGFDKIPQSQKDLLSIDLATINHKIANGLK